MPSRRPRFTYDTSTGRYRDARGRFVDQRRVRRWLEERVTASRARVVSLGDRLQTRQLSLRAWVTAMRRELKNLHGMSAMAAKGGRRSMTAADWGRTGSRLKFQYQKLDTFAQQLARGPVPRFTARVQMYANAARRTYHESQREAMEAVGFLLERNVLTPADHCEGCLRESARGWVPIGELVPIGERTCLTSCRCEIEYGPADVVAPRRRRQAA